MPKKNIFPSFIEMPFTTKKTQTLNLFYFFLSNVLCFFSYSLPAYHSNCGFLIPHTCNGLIYPLDGAFYLRVRWLASAHTSSRVSRIPSLLAGCRGQNRRTEGGGGGAEGQLQLEFFFWCFFFQNLYWFHKLSTAAEEPSSGGAPAPPPPPLL